MNKTTIRYPDPTISAFRKHVAAPSQQTAQAQNLPPISRRRGELAAQRRLKDAEFGQGPMPTLEKRSARAPRQLPPRERGMLMASGTPAITQPADHTARAQRQADLEQKHLDDADTLLNEMGAQWAAAPSDTQASKAELLPPPNIFAGARVPVPRPALHQPSASRTVARNKRDNPGITKSAAPVRPRLQSDVEVFAKAKTPGKNG